MKYYVISDMHAYYTLTNNALKRAGFFSEKDPHKLIVLGDAFDRGPEPREMQRFMQELLENDQAILVRGNHDDLFYELATVDQGLRYSHHVHNGTYETALQLTGFDAFSAEIRHKAFAESMRETPFYKAILPSMKDYYETERFIFVHGWLPMIDKGAFVENPDWRSASAADWKKARWFNGMDLAPFKTEHKTVVCGHWHASYGHNLAEGSPEFGPGSVFTPYYGEGIIAIDGCTVVTGIVNVLVLNE